MACCMNKFFACCDTDGSSVEPTSAFVTDSVTVAAMIMNMPQADLCY